jgi:hypothetical protein
MRIDESALEQARNTDVVTFFEKYHGFTFVRRGGAYRCKQHPSLAVDSNRLSWFWHSKDIGGYGVLDYLVKVENMPFRQAVEVATGTTLTIAPPPRSEVKPPKKLVLPEKAGITLRLYDYLCNKRSIDSSIVNALIQKDMLYEDKRGNIVFVGYDEQNKPRFACLRGTYSDYRGDCTGSDKRYGFNTMANAPSGSLYIFESAIDLLSHATLANIEMGNKTAWESDNRLSLSGTSDIAMPFFLNQHKSVKELVFCLDNDTVGREASIRLMQKYADKGCSTRIEAPANKDYNADLCYVMGTQSQKPRREYSL